MLEPKWGPAADYPQHDTLEEFLAYEAGVNTVYAEVLTKIGDERLPVAFGEVFGVRQLVERYLEHLGNTPWECMMQPFFRRRFEATTGIDCSEFYVDRSFLPIVAAARLEAWLDSPDAERYEPGVRYFFGRRIPSST
ncbi:MAG: hypothetical protein HC927_05900 [Deltaproteobacteria bacterium]|nr:hypothetical protein [Deltaproteobacteria bacterium]